jgi:hypothetical protein
MIKRIFGSFGVADDSSACGCGCGCGPRPETHDGLNDGLRDEAVKAIAE